MGVILSALGLSMTNDANAILSDAQFQLKVNQTFAIDPDGIKVTFLNITSDSRCPYDVTCIWQGEARALVNIIDNDQNYGNFTLSTLSGHDQIDFGTHVLHLIQVQPFTSSTKKISITDYVITLEMSDAYKSPLKQLESGINPADVKCNQGLQLVFKQENMFPLCVKPDTSKVLIERGWATSIIGISFGNQYTSKIPDLPVLFMPCDTPYSQSNHHGDAVLYMPTNSIGKICVKYHNLNDIPEKIFGISIYDPNNSNQNVTGVTTWSNSTDDIIPKGNSTVDYWVKTGNQTGIYAMELFCTGTPFAIGYDNNSKIVSSDFPWHSGTIYCPMQAYEFHIDSLSGIGVKYIPYH